MKILCRICKSEYREEIEKLINAKQQHRQISRQYHVKLGCSLHQLEISVYCHKRHREETGRILLANAEKKEALELLSEKIDAGNASMDDVINTNARIFYIDLDLKEKLGKKFTARDVVRSIRQVNCMEQEYKKWRESRESEDAFIAFVRQMEAGEVVISP